MTKSITFASMVLLMYITTVTSKGQATIPSPIRKKLGIRAGQKIVFEEKNHEIVINNQNKLIDKLCGSLKPKVKVRYTDKKADRAIGKFLAEEYHKKYGKTD